MLRGNAGCGAAVALGLGVGVAFGFGVGVAVGFGFGFALVLTFAAARGALARGAFVFACDEGGAAWPATTVDATASDTPAPVAIFVNKEAGICIFFSRLAHSTGAAHSRNGCWRWLKE